METNNVVAEATEQNSSRKEPASNHVDSEVRYQPRAELFGNPRTRIGFLLAGLVLVAASFWLWRYLGSYESTDDAQIDGHVNSVSARVGGHVVKVNVADNQYVEKGTVLFEIDPTDYQVAVSQARAVYADAQAQASAAGITVPMTNVSTASQVSAAQAGVSNAKAGVVAARQQFEMSKAQVTQADANNTKAQNDLTRYRQLIEKQEISQQQYDQAVASAQASAATLQATKASADAASAQIQQAEERLSQAGADLRTANTAPQIMQATKARALSAQANAERRKAELDQAELNLQYTRVAAPVSGIVSARTVEVGQNVQPGQEMLKVIPLDEGNIWVTANFKETQLTGIKPGLPVDIAVDATGRTYKGHVDSIAGASGDRFSLLPAENATGNYVKVVQRVPVKIVFDPGEVKGRELRPGTSALPKVWLNR